MFRPEELTTIEQALMSEIGRTKHENTQSMSRLVGLMIEGFSEKTEVPRETADRIYGVLLDMWNNSRSVQQG